MPYDHYLFDMSDMDEVLIEINEQKEEIISMAAIPESQQICILVKRENERVEQALKTLFESRK